MKLEIAKDFSWTLDSSSLGGFAAAWKLGRMKDLSTITRSLPDGVAIFSPSICAGPLHLRGVLEQALQSRNRGNGMLLARNSAIDLLMRLTCQSQIKEAMRVSGIASTNSLGAFGFADEESKISLLLDRVKSALGTAVCEDYSLLGVDSKKIRYLRELHSIPGSVPDGSIVNYLLESSALLCLSK